MYFLEQREEEKIAEEKKSSSRAYCNARKRKRSLTHTHTQTLTNTHTAKQLHQSNPVRSCFIFRSRHSHNQTDTEKNLV